MTYLKILLIRHAQSVGNVQKRMEGHSSTALSPLGQRQAQALACSLLPEDKDPSSSHRLPTHLYSSPLLRAGETADALATKLQLRNHAVAVTCAEQLKEIDQGIFEGLTWSQAQDQYPSLCSQLMMSLEWQPVPGAESPAQARARAIAWVSHILSVHQPGQIIWAVSHAGILQHIIAALLGCDRTWKTQIGHTAISEFWLASTHWQQLGQNRFNPEYWQIRRFNDTSHLRVLPATVPTQ